MNELMSTGEQDLATLAEQINAEHALCGKAARTSLEHAIRAGTLLLEAKAKVPHGEWLPWLASNTNVSPRTAQGYMQIARNTGVISGDGESATVAHLGVRETLALLAETPQSEPQEPTLWDRVTDGAPVPDAPPPQPAPLDTAAPHRITDAPAPYNAPAPVRYELVPPPEDVIDQEPEPEPEPRDDAAQQALERWKKEDAIHKALESVNRLTLFDADEAAQSLTGVSALGVFVRTHKEIAEAGAAWLLDYARALGQRFDEDLPTIRRVQ